MNTTTKMLLAASLATAIAAPIAAATAPAATDGAQKVHCYGVNKCKGVGDCGGKGNSCKGTNACKGQGFLEIEKDTCLKLEGGSLTAPAKK